MNVPGGFETMIEYEFKNPGKERFEWVHGYSIQRGDSYLLQAYVSGNSLRHLVNFEFLTSDGEFTVPQRMADVRIYLEQQENEAFIKREMKAREDSTRGNYRYSDIYVPMYSSQVGV
jgi:hypothetical protein